MEPARTPPAADAAGGRRGFFRGPAGRSDPTKVAHNPQGPADSDDPTDPGAAKRVLRGGSFLCAERYCTRYLVGSRGKGAPDSGAVNIGIRCVKDAPAGATTRP